MLKRVNVNHPKIFYSSRSDSIHTQVSKMTSFQVIFTKVSFVFQSIVFGACIHEVSFICCVFICTSTSNTYKMTYKEVRI